MAKTTKPREPETRAAKIRRYIERSAIENVLHGGRDVATDDLFETLSVEHVASEFVTDLWEELWPSEADKERRVRIRRSRVAPAAGVPQFVGT